MRNCNMLLVEKQQRYQRYHLEKFINMNLTGEEILPFNQRQIIEQAKFTYFFLVKEFEKQRKIIQDQGIKQTEVLKA